MGRQPQMMYKKISRVAHNQASVKPPNKSLDKSYDSHVYKDVDGPYSHVESDGIYRLVGNSVVPHGHRRGLSKDEAEHISEAGYYDEGYHDPPEQQEIRVNVKYTFVKQQNRDLGESNADGVENLACEARLLPLAVVCWANK
ncbi:hypothetical protein Daesc_010179 [Daldinia eschscholtzii]|uniref:Uncharacterized protein n=1 Tax=Daldinia eschscholtzii TaxID=292717 RepID=A0AAX6M7H5_9PEZI